MFKLNNRNTITRCEICSKLTIKTPERLYVLIMSRTRFRVNLHSIFAWMSRNSLLETGAIKIDRSGLLIVDFEHISHLVLVSLLLTEQVNAGWEVAWQLAKQFVYQVFYARYQVSFYLWRVRHVLKHCEVPKYYFDLCNWMMIQVSGKSVQLAQKTLVLSKNYQ